MLQGIPARRVQAVQVGLDATGGHITGQELDALSDADLKLRAASTYVFCRIAPEVG